MADQHDVQEVLDEVQWEKSSVEQSGGKTVKRSGRWRFLVLGVALLGAIGYLMFSGTGIGARYYVTVDDLLNDQDMLSKKVRVSGAVDGDPVFDPATNELRFVVANIPNDNDSIRDQGGLAKVLYTAVNNSDATRLQVVAYDQEIPDLLKHEAQAIMSGHLEMVDGEPVFYAEEITLKCPTKYEEDIPEQVVQ
jgi:cytochrome c-type biogenesis protein CcmE